MRQALACGVNLACEKLLPSDGARWRTSMGVAAAPALLWLGAKVLGAHVDVAPLLVPASLLTLLMIGAYVTYWCEAALGDRWLRRLLSSRSGANSASEATTR